MATKPRAYVDTSALIAFADRSDSYHVLFRRLFSDLPPLITTGLVGQPLAHLFRGDGLRIFAARLDHLPEFRV